MVILTHKIDTLIILTNFLRKCEKSKEDLHIETEGVISISKKKSMERK